jgi:glycosyltransferase involved in cell wall biosynthesis
VRKHFTFVMEQGLGHVVHSMNLEQVLKSEPDIDATILPVRPAEGGTTRHLPLAGNWSVQMSTRTRRALSKTLQIRRPDAIFIHTQVAALFATRIMREVPTVVSLDATPLNFDTMSTAYGHRRQTALLEHTKLWMNRRALSGAAAIVTWSEWAAGSVINDYRVPADRVHPIYPGVDIGRFRPTDKNAHGGPLRVIFIGGDFTRKGGNDLVEAAVRLTSRIELDVVTSAVDFEIPAGAPVRLHRGVKPNSDELLQLMASADVFALPTRGDTLALVIAEAMACGLPVVATTMGAIPDMVVDGVNGTLVSPGEVGELAGALEALAADPALRHRMGEAARGFAEREHDAETNWRKIFGVMSAAADSRNTGLNRAPVSTHRCHFGSYVPASSTG